MSLKVENKPNNRISLQSEYPNIASLWHPELNFDISPSDVKPKSNKKRWWLCPKSDCHHKHEWKAPPSQLVRAFEKYETLGCPYCSRSRICECNSFAKKHPKLLEFWDYDKNSDLNPFAIPPKSNKKVWWKCSKGPDHEWKTSPAHIVGGTGCPFCSTPPKKVSITNCMATRNPQMAELWDYERNYPLTPNDVLPGTFSKKYWWRCQKGSDHVWESSPANIGSRIKTKFKGIGCPFCDHRKLSKTNRLDLNNKTLALEWDYELNGNLTPADVTYNSDIKVWWRCQKGPDHVWKTTVGSRHHGTGCPCCDGKKLSVTNRLDILYPEIAKQWHPTKNNGKKPENYVALSGKRVWWKCPEGPDHEWSAVINSRTKGGRGCRFCANRKGCSESDAVSITNSLESKFPDISNEWHPTKNGDLNPRKIVFGSHKKVWWICEKGHEWKTSVDNRTGEKKTGCPSCAKYGINIDEPTFYYSMKILDGEDVIWWKGGISVDPERRLSQIERSLRGVGLHYKIQLIEIIKFKTGFKALEFEDKLLKISSIREETQYIFSGFNELFSTNPLNYAIMHNLIDNTNLIKNDIHGL